MSIETSHILKKRPINIVTDETIKVLNQIIKGNNSLQNLKYLMGIAKFLAKKLASTAFKENQKDLVFGIIHKDVHYGNFLFSDAEAKIIDFDTINKGAFINDIASGIFNCCIKKVPNSDSKFFYDENLAKTFLESYHKERKLTKSELSFLGVAISNIADLKMVTHLKVKSIGRDDSNYSRDKIRVAKNVAKNISKQFNIQPVDNEFYSRSMAL
jgi:Ser/Thr protein kinase RdoA (MazF antagonist)